MFLISCAVYSAEGKFIWEFLYAFPAVCTKSSCTLVGKAAHSPAHSCHQHALGSRASKARVWGFLSPFHQQEGNLQHLSPLHLPLKAGKPHDAGERHEDKTLLFPQLLHPLPLRGRKKQEIFAFQLLISSPPSAAATDTVLMQGFTFTIWKAARQVQNMQTWHIKKRQEVCYNIPEWPSSTAEPQTWEQTVSSWSLFLKPDLPMCHTGNHS